MQEENDKLNPLLSLRFFVTPLHNCNYFSDREAVTLVVDPALALDGKQYTELSALGFRRSGEHVYRPHCPNCRDCIPIRLEVNRFRPNLSQRRIWRMNENIQLVTKPAGFDAEHYALYRHYIQARHPAGGRPHAPQQTQALRK